MDRIKQLDALVEAAATSLKYSGALDTERGVGQVDLIVAAVGLPEEADSHVVQAIEDAIALKQAQASFALGKEKLASFLV